MEKILYLKWNNYSSTFLKTLTDFQNKERLCDSTLVCHGKFYPVHRLILSLSSDYFEDIFERTPCKHPFLILNDIEPAQLEAVLSFIYQGEVKVPHKSFPQFIKAAETLKIKGLISDNCSSSRIWENSEEYETASSIDSKVYSQVPVANCNDSIYFEDVKPDFTQLGHVSVTSIQNTCMKGKNSPVILDPMLSVQQNFPYADDISSPHDQDTDIKYKYQGKKRGNGDFTARNKRKKPQKLAKRPLKYRAKNANIVKSNTEELETEKQPLRKSPRKIKRICYADFIKTELDSDSENQNLENIEISCDVTSRITIASYSGGRNEEFEDSRAANPEEFQDNGSTSIAENEEYVSVKVEPADFTVDENGFLDDNTSINTDQIKTEPLDSEAGEFSSGLSNNKTSMEYQDLETICVEQPSYIEAFDDYVENYNEHGWPVDAMEFTDEGQMPDSKLIKCRFCPFTSVVQINLRAHEEAHSYEISYKCEYCWYRSIHKSNVQAHEKCKHIFKTEKANQSADITDNIYPSVEIEVESVNVDHDPLDNSEPVEAVQNNTIEKSDSQPGLFKCKLCKYTSKYVGYVRLHQRAHKGKVLQCKSCSYTAFFKSIMERHEMIHQSPLKKPRKNKGKYKCNHCSYKTDVSFHMRRHQITHSTVKPFSCRFCQFRSAYKASIKGHEQSHLKNTDIVEADLKEVEDSINEEENIQEEGEEENGTNTEDKPYKCRLCPFRSAVKRYALYHELTHGENKSLKCIYCPYCTNNLRNLKKHKRRWHKERLQKEHSHPLKCRYCSYVAKTKTYLKEHLTVHTGEKPYHCKLCDFKCNFKTNFTKHKRVHHSEAPTE